MQIQVILLISFILLFSGCLDNATIEDRLACLELTSYSFTSVPDCSTQEKCFEEVESKFNFNESTFSSKVQESIFNAKNHLARSWLFLNKAKANLKIIHNQCYSAKKLSLVPQQVNELNSNIVVVAEEIDSFNKEAAKAISFEINNLELEDINIVREEFLFDDYVILNQNVIDFSEKNIHNNTYASRFLFEAEKFNVLAETLELQNNVSETTLFGILAENDKVILSEAKKQDFPITFIAPIFTGLSDFLSNFFALSGSVESLKNLPSFELFSALNNLIGAENSAASSFFGMFADNSEHRISLQEKNSLERIKINENLNLASEKVLLISQNYGDYFFPEILFSQDSALTLGLSTTSFSLSDFENFSSNFNKKIEKIKSSVRSLDEAEFLEKISLGQKTRILKELSKESKNILEELNYFDELLISANQTCEQKLSTISEEISKPEFDSSNPVIISAKTRLKTQIKFFNETQTIDSCSEALKTYSNLLAYLDSSNPEEEVSIQIDSCILKVEALMNFDDGSLGLQLDSLKRIEKPYENPDLVLNSCLDLLQKLEVKALSGRDVLLANQFYKEVSEKAVLMENLLVEFPGTKTAKRVIDFIDDFSSFEPNFEDFGLILSETHNAGKIADDLTAFSSGADKILQQLAPEITENYLQVELLDSIGETNGSFARIFIENPSGEINVPFSTVIDLDSANAKEIFSTGNISYLSNENKTTLKFSKLLTGLNSIILDLNFNAKKPEINPPIENDFLDFAEKQRIIFEKELLLEKASSVLEDDLNVKLSGEKIQFYADQNKLEKAAEELQNLEFLVNSVPEFKAEENKSSDEENTKIGILKLSLDEKIALLESNFSSLTTEQLKEIYVFSPITLERIKELKNQLNNKTEPAGLEELAKLETIDKEVTSAIEKLKQNSFSSYNVAVSKRNSSEPNPEADSLLLKSKQALEEKSYLESIYNSYKASNLTDQVTISPPFEIPLAVYPLILVLLGVAFYVYKKSEEEKKPKPVVKIRKVSSD
ncbi:MAG: hypothetical protein ABIH20_03775 [Candidatus Diapherotrites archaeon]